MVDPNSINPIPYGTPMQTQQGLVTPAWSSWFRQILNKIGSSGSSGGGVTLPVSIANGGTGQVTQSAAITALSGSQVSGKYLRSNGTNTVLSAIQAGDVPTLNQNTTGNAATASNGFSSGMIIDFGGGSAPMGWLICDGSTFSSVTYAALASILGDTFGVHSGTNYYLPDCRGRCSVGVGTGSGLTARTLGASGGEEAHALTIAELAAHTHSNQMYANVTGASVGWNQLYNSVQSLVGGVITSSTGSGTAHNTMQPFLGLNRIIKT